jgi:predicted RNA-binding protein YlqC (UPF0109 family)
MGNLQISGRQINSGARAVAALRTVLATAPRRQLYQLATYVVGFGQ